LQLHGLNKGFAGEFVDSKQILQHDDSAAGCVCGCCSAFAIYLGMSQDLTVVYSGILSRLDWLVRFQNNRRTALRPPDALLSPGCSVCVFAWRWQHRTVDGRKSVAAAARERVIVATVTVTCIRSTLTAPACL